MGKTNLSDLAARIDAPSLLGGCSNLHRLSSFALAHCGGATSADIAAPPHPKPGDPFQRHRILLQRNTAIRDRRRRDAALVMGRIGGSWRAATYSIFVDRAIGLIALAINVVASLPWSYQFIDNLPPRPRLSSGRSRPSRRSGRILILGKLKWPWLERWRCWWPYVDACSVIASARFSRECGLQSAVCPLSWFTFYRPSSRGALSMRLSPRPPSIRFSADPPVILITLIPIFDVAGWVRGDYDGSCLRICRLRRK